MRKQIHAINESTLTGKDAIKHIRSKKPHTIKFLKDTKLANWDKTSMGDKAQYGNAIDKGVLHLKGNDLIIKKGTTGTYFEKRFLSDGTAYIMKTPKGKAEVVLNSLHYFNKGEAELYT